MPAGFHEPKKAHEQPKRLFLYGPPKTVKTPLALAFGAYLRTINPNARTLYIAADDGAEDLPSLPNPEWRQWIDVWKPGSPLEKDAAGKSLFDPYRDAMMVAFNDWKGQNPDCELIIWDTMTTNMEDILQHCADQEFFANQKGESKHVTFGDPRLPKGHPARMNVPVMGDYQGAGRIAHRLTKLMGAQRCHVILICHEESFDDAKGISRIGPAFVGKKLVGKLPGYLTGIIYTEKFGEIDKKTGKLRPTLYVCSDPADDAHIAGVRHQPATGSDGVTSPKNPIPRVKVGDDLVAYWKLFFETLFPVEQPTAAK